MEESNLSDGENASDENENDVDVEEQQHNDNVKRIKTENGLLENNTDDSVWNETSNTAEPSTSTSNEIDFDRYQNIDITKNARNSNTRNKEEDESSNDSEINSESVHVHSENIFHHETDSSEARSNSVILDTDVEDEEEEDSIKNVLKKPKPKHKWFVVPEVLNRQLGCTPKKQSSELFQRRCYGSLHCVQRLELMYKLEKHEGCVNGLNFHPSGDLLASTSDDLKVVLWDWKNGRSLLSYHTKHRGNVFQSKFLPLTGDLHIATCARDGQVRLAQVSTQEGLRSLRKLGSHTGSCNKLSVLVDQPQILLSAGEDAVVLRHDLRSSQPTEVITVKGDSFVNVALYSINSHPLNTHEFCVAGRDSMVRTFDLRTGHQLKSYHAFKGTTSLLSNHITSAVYNHNGTEILASYNDEDIYLFDVNDECGNYIHHYQGHRNGATIKGVNFFGPKSEYIVSGSDCGNIYFWDRETEAIVQWLLADDRGVVNCLEPHPQLPFLCTSGLDWDIKVWVPSYEQDPQMKGLAEVVRNNLRNRSQGSTSIVPDIEHMWMLWRQLRGQDQVERVFHYAMENSLNADLDSDFTASEDIDSDDDDSDGPIGCTTS